ncbi:MAG: hypothetical protein ABIO99_10305 [Candidatus Limnocylindria bacterium]
MVDAARPRSDWPDGIKHDHVRPVAGWRRHASPLALVVFGAVIALGLTGVLGHERTWTAAAQGTTLTVEAPETIRNGEFFEMRISATSDGPLSQLAVGIDRALLADMTVNTMIPAATDEASAGDEYRFTFAPLDAGDTFLFKVDVQVNPDIFGGNHGTITLYDGEERLVATTIEIRVLP